jgi:hypothetical protein
MLRSYLYGPPTSRMSGIGTLCARVRLPASRVDRQFNYSTKESPIGRLYYIFPKFVFGSLRVRSLAEATPGDFPEFPVHGNN